MGEALQDRLRADLNQARRDRDRLRTTVLTTTLSEVRNREIEIGGRLDDPGTLDVLTKAIKRRREAAEQMTAGGREELAAVEREEAAILGSYLPAALGEAEVRALVRESIDAGADTVGAVMGRIVPAIKGRFDGREANRIVREELGA
jgi:uncharacterized protein